MSLEVFINALKPVRKLFETVFRIGRRWRSMNRCASKKRKRQRNVTSRRNLIKIKRLGDGNSIFPSVYYDDVVEMSRGERTELRKESEVLKWVSYYWPIIYFVFHL